MHCLTTHKTQRECSHTLKPQNDKFRIRTDLSLRQNLNIYTASHVRMLETSTLLSEPQISRCKICMQYDLYLEIPLHVFYAANDISCHHSPIGTMPTSCNKVFIWQDKINIRTKFITDARQCGKCYWGRTELSSRSRHWLPWILRFKVK